MTNLKVLSKALILVLLFSFTLLGTSFAEDSLTPQPTVETTPTLTLTPAVTPKSTPEPTPFNPNGSFNDISKHWAKPAIESAFSKGLLKGYPEGTFKPNNPVTRGEFATFLSRATKQTVLEPIDIPFEDVMGHWSFNDVQKDVSLRFIMASDYPNGFSPDTPITRREISRWLANGLSSNSEDYKQSLLDMKNTYVPVSEMFKSVLKPNDIPLVGLMLGTGLLSGYPDFSFGLDKNITRAEVATILLRYIDVESKKADDFLGLRELREVGTTGTNLTTITPMRYGQYTDGYVGEFKNIRDKKLTVSGQGTVVLNYLIAVDIRSKTDYTGIYGKMFISNDFYLFPQKGVHYFFTLSTITATTDNFNDMVVSNSTHNWFQSPLGEITNKVAIANGLPTNYPKYKPKFINRFGYLQPGYYADEYKKGVARQYWGWFADGGNQGQEGSIQFYAKVDDGSIFVAGGVFNP
ncbi:S-layer homology domain-containing protein [Paenibacillus psychroresistens]|uniref:S-layer homology domain-containing protein n=1 Tax=Paenibacillus psychroresistens TaxID=1778678 RepID=A0A6B8RR28_9BACL|nr:S-layer homology domain-containing protein [Paenibacillus psychroresistens]QGQ97943.1 S-layer homology domain-containing protein [Paenibacillus psychroresistens]